MNDYLINFYLVLSGRHGADARDRLHELCASTISHPAELDAAVELRESEDVVLRAWSCWASCWIGRKGRAGRRDAMNGNPQCEVDGERREQCLSVDLGSG